MSRIGGVYPILRGGGGLIFKRGQSGYSFVPCSSPGRPTPGRFHFFVHDVSVMGSAPTVSTKPGCVVFILKQEGSDQNISAYFRPKVTEL